MRINKTVGTESPDEISQKGNFTFGVVRKNEKNCSDDYRANIALGVNDVIILKMKLSQFKTAQL
jgi:hypothetical protein